MFELYKNKIKPWLKEKNLPYCLHKWELVNPKEVASGGYPIKKCKRCKEYLK